ncbi:hypothetical protein P167DRAFT_548273 [Morchella conica CCBAS932]|uniref:Uncharacterized protein n=1 Tax=Morchella conica CCBAS932 TaxID=1392247 RepID=A0A3N4KFD4_9PEZI|nr:hypothetical protein P167DRAFT_548273 [Morchella conica CCBAS932]
MVLFVPACLPALVYLHEAGRQLLLHSTYSVPFPFLSFARAHHTATINSGESWRAAIGSAYRILWGNSRVDFSELLHLPARRCCCLLSEALKHCTQASKQCAVNSFFRADLQNRGGGGGGAGAGAGAGGRGGRKEGRKGKEGGMADDADDEAA